MSQCTDPKLGRMLYAYELGGLNEDDRRAFEIHLVECGHCFDQVQSFQRTAEVLRSDRVVRKEIAGLQSEGALEEDSNEEPVLPKWRNWLKVAVAAAAVIVVLLLSPWELEFKPTSEAVAAEPLLAIMYFDDMTGAGEESRYGEICADLLITDLSESEYVTVVSSQRLYDILSLLGHTGVKTITKDLASSVVSKARAKYMLTGSLLQVEPTVILTGQLVEANSGNVLASQRIMGGEDEDLFACVDRLSEEVKIDLSLPQEAYDEEDRSLCDLSSCSLDAYQLYLQGVEQSYQGLVKKSRESFAAAIEIDSTFCVAYYRYALASSGAERKRLVRKAVELKSYASKKEQMYISALAYLVEDKDQKAVQEYLRIVRDYPDEKEAHYRLALMYWAYSKDREALQHLEAAVEIDPHYKPAVRSMALYYSATGDLERSLQSHTRYIELWPDDPQGPSARGTTYARWGRFDEALADWREALRMEPEQWRGVLELGLFAVITGDFELADSCLSVVEQNGTIDQKLDAEFIRCVAPFRKGHIRETLDLLNGLAGPHRGRENFGQAYFKATDKLTVQSMIFSSMGQHEKALEKWHEARVLFDSLNPGRQHEYTGRYRRILLVAATGRIEDATQMAEEFREHMAGDFDHVFYYQSLLASGGVEYMKGNYELALSHFRSAAERNDRLLGGNFLLHYMMGKCYQAAGYTSQAIEQYEDALTRIGSSSHVQYFNHEVDLLLNLASVYEETGDNDNAIKHYRRVQELWKDADEDIKQMFGYYGAMERLARLESQT